MTDSCKCAIAAALMAVCTGIGLAQKKRNERLKVVTFRDGDFYASTLMRTPGYDVSERERMAHYE
jgi:hypothetical protein